SIIAPIITTHMPTNDAAVLSHVWPGIRIHIIDIVQPPGIGISPISSAPRVLVVTAPPETSLVAPSWRTIEPLVHAPQTIESARIGGVGVVDDAALEDKGARARPSAGKRGRVSSRRGRDGGNRLAAAVPGALAPVVVFNARALLRLGESDAEVGVEVTAE